MSSLTISDKQIKKLVMKRDFSFDDLCLLRSLDYTQEEDLFDLIREDTSLLPFERVIKQHIFNDLIQEENDWAVKSLISLSAFHKEWNVDKKAVRIGGAFVQAYRMIASENEGSGFSALHMIGLDYKKVFSAWLLWWNEGYDYDLTVGKLEKALSVMILDTLSREALNKITESVLTKEERKIVFEESKSNPSLEGFNNFYRF